SMKEHQRFNKNYFFKKILVYEEKVWWEEVKEKPKLRTYRLFKNRHLRLEKYLLTPGFYYGRTLMADIRMGTNQLESERGRWEGKTKEARYCRQCEHKEVEDEFHFMIKCHRYTNFRSELFNKIKQVSNGKW